MIFGGTGILNNTFTIPDVYADLNDAWWNNSWEKRLPIVIDSNEVSGSTDLTDFPILVNLSGIDVSNIKNDIQNNGEDIRFTDTSKNLLSYEIEKYDETTNELIAWVKIPSLSSTIDTTIYMYFDNDSATDGQNKNAVWDSNYNAVYHLNNNADDSTSLNNDLSIDGATSTLNGKIGTAYDFDGDNDKLSATGLSLPVGNSPYTLEAWINSDTITVVNTGIVGWGNYGSVTEVNAFRLGGTGFLVNYWWGDDIPVDLGDSFFPATYRHVVSTYDGTTRTLYVDSVSVTSDNPSTHNVPNTDNFAIGRTLPAPSEFFDGIIDEPRISNVARSADWISTEYNNQNSPGTFYTVNSVEGSPTFTAKATSLNEITLTFDQNVDVTTTNGAGWSLTGTDAGSLTVITNTDPDDTSDTMTLTLSGNLPNTAPSINVVYDADTGTTVSSLGLEVKDNVVISATDGISPVLTGVTPSSSSVIPSDYSVSYTLSEAVSSGTITFTHTGGEDDATPHTRALSSAERTVGPHTLFEPFNLVDTAVYTMNVTVTDAASNGGSAETTNITFDNAPGLTIVFSGLTNTATNGVLPIGQTVTLVITESTNAVNNLILDGSSLINGVLPTLVSQGNGIYHAIYTISEGDADVVDSAVIPYSITLKKPTGVLTNTVSVPLDSNTSLGVDAHYPTLDDATPDLNLDDSTLSFDFNEPIDVSAIDLSGISITDKDGNNPVTLSGATAPSVDSDTFNITITDLQKEEIFSLTNPLKIIVSATAISDVSGNNFAGIANNNMDVTNSNVAPTLNSARLSGNIITLVYNTNTTSSLGDYTDLQLDNSCTAGISSVAYGATGHHVVSLSLDATCNPGTKGTMDISGVQGETNGILINPLDDTSVTSENQLMINTIEEKDIVITNAVSSLNKINYTNIIPRLDFEQRLVGNSFITDANPIITELKEELIQKIIMEIPPSTTFTTATGSALLSLPSPNTDECLRFTPTVNSDISSCYSVGQANNDMLSDKTIKITLKDEVGTTPYYIDGTGTRQITTQCVDDTITSGLVAPNKECYIESGNDIVLLITHFTGFGTGFGSISSSSSGGGSDASWKTKPTFGISHETFLPLVENGFSYKINSHDTILVDITDNWHTDFTDPKISVGDKVNFTAKMYAPNNEKRIEFIFGIPEAGYAEKSLAAIEIGLHRNYTSTTDVIITDVTLNQDKPFISLYTTDTPYNKKCITPIGYFGTDMQCVEVTAHRTPCLTTEDTQCVTVSVNAKFNMPLGNIKQQQCNSVESCRDFVENGKVTSGTVGKVFAIKGVDDTRRSHITYLNEGLSAVGESSIPSDTMTKIFKKGSQYPAYIVHITEIDSVNNIWVDNATGEYYHLNDVNTWFKLSDEPIMPACNDSSVTSNRDNCIFDIQKREHTRHIEEIRDNLYGKLYTEVAFEEIHDIFSYKYPETSSRDKLLQEMGWVD